MKIIKIYTTFLILLLIFSCKKANFKLNDEAIIPFGKTIEIQLSSSEKMTLQFIDLLEDSRCPPNVTCSWAGECSFSLIANGKDKLNFGFPDDIYSAILNYGDYKITITDLSYDKDDNFGSEKHCTVKLKVE